MKALIAMSGGVDSSVAAKLMVERGYDCIGCTMKLYDNEDCGISNEHTCCTLDDVEDARAVATRLGMPYYVFNMKDGFRECVIEPFIRAYECGQTPNPCIECNRCMKFSRLYQRAKELSCDCIVTGHYARIEQLGDKWVLKKALDSSKDQSYVLYSLTQEQLAHTVFPLGTMEKAETRALAEASGFVNARKHDSQDICFVPDGDYAKVIENFTKKAAKPGNFVDETGKILGRHAGIIHYTIGQHRGLGLGIEKKLFVLRVDAEKNEVVLGASEQLFKKDLTAKNFNWISGSAPQGAFRCKAKIRYRQIEQPATVTAGENNTISLTFDEPQRAITPGQSVVLYDGETVLGGGIIE